MSKKDIVIFCRSDPGGIPMSSFGSTELSEELCNLAGYVMDDQDDTKFSGIAVRGTSHNGGLVQVTTGLLVERYSDRNTPEGLLQLSGRALLLFTARDGFGVALADTVIAESYGEIAAMKVKRSVDQIALGMVSMSAFSVDEISYSPRG